MANHADKGFTGTLGRAALLPFRYGFNRDRIGRRLRLMSEIGRRWEFTPSVPLTACNLVHHADLTSELREFDVAIHGYEHVAYAGLTKEQQGRDLDAAIRTLSRFEIHATGFRSPYLLANSDTRALLRRRGFVFDSSVPRFMLDRGHPIFADMVSLAERRYGNQVRLAQTPGLESGLVELPVALPDDELLVDGLGIRNAAVLSRILEAMLDVARKESSIIIFQVHPERAEILSPALNAMLRTATDQGAWKTSLSEAAAWIASRVPGMKPWPRGHSYAICLSGDLDAVTLADFARRIWRT